MHIARRVQPGLGNPWAALIGEVVGAAGNIATSVQAPKAARYNAAAAQAAAGGESATAQARIYEAQNMARIEQGRLVLETRRQQADAKHRQTLVYGGLALAAAAVALYAVR